MTGDSTYMQNISCRLFVIFCDGFQSGLTSQMGNMWSRVLSGVPKNARKIKYMK